MENKNLSIGDIISMILATIFIIIGLISFIMFIFEPIDKIIFPDNQLTKEQWDIKMIKIDYQNEKEYTKNAIENVRNEIKIHKIESICKEKRGNFIALMDSPKKGELFLNNCIINNKRYFWKEDENQFMIMTIERL